MDLKLENKVALVTGGSRGIGAAIVDTLAGEGGRVHFTHKGDAEGASSITAALDGRGLGATAHEADAADLEQTKQLVSDIVAAEGRIDLLVCNAGITADAVSWKLPEADWDRVLAVNLKGCFNHASTVIPVMRAHGGGRIVNLASINGMRGKFGQVNYAASKGGVIALTKSLAREVGRFGITVNAVAPGLVATELIRSMPESSRTAAIQESALGRIAEPQDVADLVAFLCAARARHITGTCMRVDGGQFMG
jgi:3-oxoacyl-[acyl-carrier protein] reductase